MAGLRPESPFPGMEPGCKDLILSNCSNIKTRDLSRQCFRRTAEKAFGEVITLMGINLLTAKDIQITPTKVIVYE